MYWSVVSAKHLGGYRLAVAFEDGKSGVVDLEKQLRKGPVFKRLLDVEVFKQFRINPDFGVICWGDDLDIAPETLYDQAIRSRSSAVVAEAKGQYTPKRKKRAAKS